MKERDSNIELLRIIAMFMITLHHFLVDPNMTYSCIVGRAPIFPGYELATIINGFLYVGVNCFVLISGYYGIKFKWRGVYKLWLMCAFYIFCSPIIAYWLHGAQFSLWQTVHDTVFCFSYNVHWFINYYIYLLFLSPLLNFAQSSMNKKQHLYVLVLLTILSLYFGFWRHDIYWNKDGYTVGQFIYLYLIGGYIQRYVRIEKTSRWLLFSLYLTCCIIWGVLTIIKYNYGVIGHWRPVTYNNPFMLIGAIAFFMFMRTFTFHSKFVNRVAQSVLAVYLFGGISYLALDKYIQSLLPSGLYMPLLSAFLGAVFVFCIVIAFDNVRILLCKPMWWLWGKGEQLTNIVLVKIKSNYQHDHRK